MKKTALIFSFLLTVALAAAQRPALHFDDEGRFKILQFTDLHITDDGDGSEARSDSTCRLIETMAAEQKPDLMVLTGDNVWNTTDAMRLWRRLCATLENTGVPYAVCFGNHDEETDVNNAQILDYLLTQPHNLTRDDAPLSGAGNCMLPVAASAGDSRTDWALYIIDSHNNRKGMSFDGYDWIRHDQIDWYRAQSDSLAAANGGVTVPALAFFHIPLPEFDSLRKDYKLTGTMAEAVCAPAINSGMFESMIEKGDVTGVFAGHDHNNDYFIDAGGHILLAYGRKSGYNTAYDEILPRGCRVITLHRGKRSFDTAVLDGDGAHHTYTFTQKNASPKEAAK